MEATQSQPVDDILTNNLDTVDTRNPLVKGRLKMIVKKVEQKKNAETGKSSVSIQLQLNQQGVISTDGQQLNVGTMFFDNISITPTEKWSKDDIAKQLKKFQNACGATGGFAPFERYEGRDIEVEAAIQPAKGEYSEKNRFRYVDKNTGKVQ